MSNYIMHTFTYSTDIMHTFTDSTYRTARFVHLEDVRTAARRASDALTRAGIEAEIVVSMPTGAPDGGRTPVAVWYSGMGWYRCFGGVLPERCDLNQKA